MASRTTPNEGIGRAGAATLRRLSRIDPAGHPVLSVYVDLDPARFATAGARASERTALLTEARHRAGGDRDTRADVEAVAELLESTPDLERGAAALACFSVQPIGVLEVVALPRAVPSVVGVDTIPWLAPLASAGGVEGVLVAVVDRRGARLLRDDAGHLVETDAIRDPVHGRHDQGGWSQSRYQRGIEEQVAAHVRHVAAAVQAADAAVRFDHLVVVAAPTLWPLLRRALPRSARERLIGLVEHDAADATEAEIAELVAPVLEDARARRLNAVLARIGDTVRRHGAIGLAAVLEALNAERAEALVVDPTASLRARRCPHCDALFAPPLERCPADDHALREVDAVQHAVHRAARQDADVVVASDPRLVALGGIAAQMRW